MIKLMILGRRKGGTTLAEHRHHILNVHGQKVLHYIKIFPDKTPQRYVQNEVFDGTFRANAPNNDPFTLNRDFVTQVWFDDFVQVSAATSTPFYLEDLRPDEDNFVEQSTVVRLPVMPRIIKTSKSAPPIKLFVFFKRADGIDLDSFQQAWSDCTSALSASAMNANIHQHVQNRVIAKPNAPTLVDGIDEIWLEDESTAQIVGNYFQKYFIENLVANGIVQKDTSFRLLAHESVLFEGK
jgi:EthD domain